MKCIRLTSVLLAAMLVVSCSSSQDEENKEHFASSQQRALEKAKDVGNVLQQAEDKKRQELENMER